MPATRLQKTIQTAARRCVAVRLVEEHGFSLSFAKALVDPDRECVLKSTVDDVVVDVVEQPAPVGAMFTKLDALADGIASAVAEQSIKVCEDPTCERIDAAHVAFAFPHGDEVHVCERCVADKYANDGFPTADHAKALKALKGNR